VSALQPADLHVAAERVGHVEAVAAAVADVSTPSDFSSVFALSRSKSATV
jgi:hypothetical protein